MSSERKIDIHELMGESEIPESYRVSEMPVSCSKCLGMVVYKESMSEPGCDCYECVKCMNLIWRPR